MGAGDRIELVGLRAYGRHGVQPEEHTRGQPFVVDVTLSVDLRGAGASDALRDTVDYGALADRVRAAITDTRFDLIEALAEHVAGLALDEPRVEEASVRVAKPHAPVPADVGEVAVSVTRSRESAS
ncbi:dihydroneopterin aldolase [Egibacter rhizosphaerae]|uniref:7,8-dihydroneopterin aldolase n=1 Tax=Egibacter rhizosphaerae TaxID=1670831 RepID=A0A411YDM6_9ACTN|nr:dihydroneopterin aldolase [Egibacter rhizosphaerae]QBI19276.1 dihydroneopterin aldolase [Egibacter rhizosphaerae]